MKIFITGVTSGIGLELTKQYLSEGAIVGGLGRDELKIPADIKKNPRFSFYMGDVRDKQKVKDCIDHFINTNGLDLIIACAGRSIPNKTKIPDFNLAREIIDINIHGVINTFEPSLNYFLTQKKGHLVAIASVAGLVGLPSAAAYSASKSAVLKMCESFAIDMKQHNIAVTAIVPGFIDTPLTQQNHHKMPFLMDVKTAANKIRIAIEHKQGRYIFPLSMRLIMLFLELLPRPIYRFLMGLKISNYSKAQ